MLPPQDLAARVGGLRPGPLSPADRRALKHQLPAAGPLDILQGLFDGHRLVAAALLRVQPTGPDHSALALGLAADEAAGCAWLDGCWVAPDQRGRGLHRQLVQLRLQRAQAQGHARVGALLPLDAHAARHTLMACGLHVEHTGLWQDQPRHWLLLDQRRGPALRHARPLPTRWISADDFDRQCDACAAGLRGVLERPMAGTAAPWIGYMPRGPARRLPSSP